VRARGLPIEEFLFLSGRGRRLQRIPLGDFARRHGVPAPLMIRRAALIELLSRTLQNDVEWDATCQDVEQDADGVTVRLTDGRVFRGSLVVGAEGIDSVIRTALLPQVKPRFAGYEYLRAVVRYDAPAPRGLVFVLGSRGRFIIHPVEGGWVYWAGVLAGRRSGGDDPAERKRELLERLDDLAPPVRELIEAAADDAISRSDIRDLPPLERWGEGRVTLLGDAAHATTPNLGRGASEALEDAVALARALANAGGLKGDVSKALRAYEGERRPATASIQTRAWRIGRLMAVRTPVARAARDLALRSVMGWGMAKGMEAEFAQLGLGWAAEKAHPPASPVT
jgi:FAD-dependent urate hydroxylase